MNPRLLGVALEDLPKGGVGPIRIGRLKPRLLDLSGKEWDAEVQRLITTESQKMAHHWTPKEKEIIRCLAGKVPNRVIARELGLTVNQVKGQVWILGLSRRRIE